MSNLIPHDVQETIFDRMMMRVVLVTSALFALTGIVAIAAVLPAYLTLHTEAGALSYEISSLGNAQNTATSSGNDSISSTNKRIRVLQAIFAHRSNLSLAIKRVLADEPSGISLKRISYEPGTTVGTTTGHVLSVSGIAPRTSDQNAFLSSLRADSLFSQVEIPLSALTQSDQSVLTLILHGNL